MARLYRQRDHFLVKLDQPDIARQRIRKALIKATPKGKPVHVVLRQYISKISVKCNQESTHSSKSMIPIFN